MTFLYEDRLSDSPFVEMIWHTRTESDGCYLAAADGSWDILISKRDSTANVMLCGPATQVSPVYYAEGTECIGIRFKLGTFMSHLTINNMVDTGIPLPEATHKSFWLGGCTWQVPNYENVDTFLKHLALDDMLGWDPLIDDALQGQTSELSLRTVQRRFLQITGLTPTDIRQIERARHAASLLRQGTSILDAVFMAGYTDQPHMSKSLKRMFGQTPAQIASVASAASAGGT
jgi:AraC-like DNA-binding protein